ncbi:MAG: transporter substrate-binding domain-containing protein [Micrococcales bacterium]|nr:transporter substrate-binding domain-containing protein [Micrococcales bacterium]
MFSTPRRPRVRSRMLRAVTAAACAALVPVALAGCGSSGSGDAGSAGTASAGADGGLKLVNPGKLTVCTHMAYKPFQFNKDGKIVGFDVDIVDLAAKEMGLEQQIIDIEFQQIWSGAAFKAKKCDIGAAGMTITDARKKSVAFSEPYFDATQALLVKKGSSVKDLAALRGKKLGVQTETTGQEYATKNASANGYEVVVFDDLPLEVNAVKSGRVDAAINDNGVLFDFAKDNPDTEVVAEFDTGEHYGISAAKDDANATAILGKVNTAIANAKKDGAYNEIYKKWFGTTPQPASPAASSAATPNASPSS